MYAQLVDTGVKKVQDARGHVAPRSGRSRRASTPTSRSRPKDWMPDAYRKTLIRQIPQHAHSEIVGMLPEGNWITPRAVAQAQGDPDGQGAGRRRPRPLSLRGRGNARRVARPAGRRPARRQGQVLVDLQLPDADVGRHRRDRLAGRRRGDHEPDSAVPLLVRPVRAGDGAHLQGRDLPPAPGLRHHDVAVPRHAGAEGDGAGRAQPLVVAVADDVRPARRRSVHSAQSAQWKIKLLSNDELRQRFVDQTVPQAEYLGITMPDPDLKWNAERGHYDFGAIDWSEFHNVLKGNGPCNRERLPRASRRGTTAPGCARRRWRTRRSARRATAAEARARLDAMERA